ncbi:MAG TPA: hypothetical protein VJU16_04635 [Planctomycetota bacterium]|nr:hypothetical protein [Planctomycetota bacterium]
MAAFCGGEGASLESGDSWVRLTWGAARDTLLVLLAEDQGPESFGFDHALIVESSHSKSCFLAAYFIARRCGGVVQVRQRAELIPATAFAERYLEGEDLEERWGRVFPSP